MDGRLTIHAFGDLVFTLDGQVITLTSRRELALAFYLVYTGSACSRTHLADLFWPDSTSGQARTNLRRTLTSFRQQLPGLMAISREHVQVDPDHPVWLDVHEFEVRVSQIDAADVDLLASGVALYRGDFLAHFTIDSQPFQDWVLLEQERLRLMAIEALDALVRHHEAVGDYTEALQYAARLCQMDDLREPSHRHLMRLLYQSGNRSAALAQYEAYSRLLQAELGVHPEVETQALYQKIQGDGTLATSTEDATQLVCQLPARRQTFIGRRAEIETLVHQLTSEPHCRLLTLTGIGGVGKTRLALEVAYQVAPCFRDGVCWVDLAAIQNLDNVVNSIAVQMNLQLRPGGLSPEDQLLGHLKKRQLLLVLDNYEHLVDVLTPFLELLLSHTPEIRLLITSRQPLNVGWEWLYQVDGLAVPGDWREEDAVGYDAVQLFAHRARRVRRDFGGAMHLECIVQICRQVEGMPLAIELAAAWLHVLSCKEIAYEIEQSLAFLTTRRRAESERHSSLRAVFEHSWRLLAEAEREVLMKLSVLRGSFQREAAQVITRATLPTLSSLVDKSLLRHYPDGGYSLHEAVRQFAADQLDSRPVIKTETLGRHCLYFCDFLAEQEVDLKGARHKEAADAIAFAIDNMRAAWQWAVQQRRVESIKRAYSGLYLFYDVRGLIVEGGRVFEQAAAAWEAIEPDEPDEAYQATLARLLACYGGMKVDFDTQQAIALLTRCLALLRQHDDPQLRAFVLGQLGVAYNNSGMPEEARPYLQESYACYCSLGDAFWQAIVLGYLGRMARSLYAWEEAKRLFQDSLDLAEAVHSCYAAFWSANFLGHTALRSGEMQAAAACFTKAQNYAHKVAHRYGVAEVLGYLGEISEWEGDYISSYEHFTQQLAIAREDDLPHIIVKALLNLGYLAFIQGEFDEAERYFHEVLTMDDYPYHQKYYARTLNDLAMVASMRGDQEVVDTYWHETLSACQEVGARESEAYILRNMGWDAFMRGSYNEAIRFGERSLVICRELDLRTLVPEQRAFLGHITAMQGDHRRSKQSYQEALRECWDVPRRLPLVLECIAGMARYLANAGKQVRAAEVLTLAAYHPAKTIFTACITTPLLTELATELAPNVFAAAQERGRALDLDAVVEELLYDPLLIP